jgi:hypothetical protein
MAEDKQKTGLSAFGIVAILILLTFLGWAVWYGVINWNALAGVRISPLGWVFMVLGVLVTFILGAGLMGLVFYSSRHDRDI